MTASLSTMTICEIKEKDYWRLITIRESLKGLEEPVFRCIECHGPVKVASRGKRKSGAYFRHIKRHTGCSKAGSGFKGEMLPHPDALL